MFFNKKGMNNRKLIFGIIAGVLVIGLIIFLMVAKSNQRTKKTHSSSGSFTIWTVGDSSQKFNEFLTSFKNKNRSMSKVDYAVTNFPNFKEYSTALNTAIIKGEAPDIFVLNNNETSLFEDKILAISNSEIDIHNFRKEYKTIFSNDLIVSTGEGEEKQSFLKGIPVGYETLGIFYNKGVPYRLNPTNFTSISGLLGIAQKKRKFNLITIGIGNGKVLNAGDILAQYLLINKVNSLKDGNAKSGLLEYMTYGSLDSDNSYNSLFETGQNNIDLFITKKVGAIIAYPRIIKKLQSSGFSNRFLAATPFPHRYTGDGPSLANYNFFVINQDTKQKNVAIALLKYLNSDEGAEIYLKKFSYYLPAKSKLEEKLATNKISNFYDNIELRDFYSDEPLSSFDKGNKVIYDEKVIKVLDNFNSYLSAFEKFKDSTICSSKKILNLENLTVSCE